MDPAKLLEFSWRSVMINANTGKILFSDDEIQKDSLFQQRFLEKQKEIEMHEQMGHKEYEMKQFCDNTADIVT